MGVIQFNSTYMDWIDRRFLYRGTLNTFIATAYCVLMPVMFFCLLVSYSYLSLDSWQSDWSFVVQVCVICFVTVAVMYYICLRREYFAYKYWPIRFNRKTRMVHVFRHNGRHGVLSVPWDKVFFHIGHGTDKEHLRDIRGEVLDGDIVVDTFALGHPVSKERPLYEMWEFIRRYMDEGPLAAAPHPFDRYVGLSVRPTLKNCFLSMGSYYAGAYGLIGQICASPIVVLSTLTRWVVLHTCKTPVFPVEIEATCQVDEDDPNVWPIPASSAQFAADIPGLLEYAEEKAKRQWDAEHGLRLPEIPPESVPSRPRKAPVSRRVQRWKKK